MHKSEIKRFLREQDISKFKLCEVKLVLEAPYWLQNKQPDILGMLYSLNNEHWLCIKVCSINRYNKVQRIKILDDSK